MINEIDRRLERIHAAGRTGIMTHVVVGYPSLSETEDIVRAMVSAGVDLVELQIPFSDPLADGQTIQDACEAALDAGIRVRDAFTVARQLSDVSVPLLFMCYFNTIFRYGIDAFCKDAAEAGISGLIVPDASLEAAIHDGYLESCEAAGLHNIITLSPLSTPARIQKNAPYASGFVYCMARQGVTGVGQLHDQLGSYIARVRESIKTPVALGFGISSRDRLDLVAPYCDVAVVGSAVIDVIKRSAPGEAAANVEKFVYSLTS